MRDSFPDAPGGPGKALAPSEVMPFLSHLRNWIVDTRLALDELDTAIMATGRSAEFQQDLTLSLSLWKAVGNEQQALLRIWDSGRANASGLANLNKGIWGRLEGTQSQAFNLPEAGRLVDLLVLDMLAQLQGGADFTQVTRRIRNLRVGIERIRDQIGAQRTLLPIATQDLSTLADRLSQVAAKHARGGDVVGELAALEYQAARLERDLIKAAAAAHNVGALLGVGKNLSANPAADGQKCPEPGCFGAITESYCNVCGMRIEQPAPLPSLPAGQTETSAANEALTTGAITGDRCNQPGCPGTITEEYCDICGARFLAEVKLTQGENVAGQYRICGVLGHGGQGWTYLAQDMNVDNRWVVLKGLLNPTDPKSRESASAERRTLARVGTHPQIVEIYNFVTHRGAQYIVMQFVPGKSAKQLLQERTDEAGQKHPLPLIQALDLILQTLPAIEHLHKQGLLYIDFKPDNIMIGERVMLIDLGSVREITCADALVLATVGYSAPELERDGASVASDVFAIGRTLLRLSTDESTMSHPALPPRDADPVLAANADFYALLERCLALNPDERFSSVGELRAQLQKVLGAGQSHPREPMQNHRDLSDSHVPRKQWTETRNDG
ncbi:MAG: serine/threonine protein kinase [Propionibacteriaceae bacterium]|jgi:hypothetical protein|nr:serine/threonine protein kinase [Propionibacteriaceae bacterium]